MSLLLFLIYAYFLLSDIPMAQSIGMSIGEYVLLAITNHYYLIYGYFPYLLYWCCKNMRRDRSLELVRIGSYGRYYNRQIYQTFQKLGILILMHVLFAFSIGFPFLPIENQFLAHSATTYDSSNFAVVHAFAAQIRTPGLGVMLVAGYLILGSMFLFQILYFASLMWGDIGMILSVCSCMINVIVGFKCFVGIAEWENFFLNHYFILHHALQVGVRAVGKNVGIMLIGSIFMKHSVIYKKTGRILKRKKEKSYVNILLTQNGKMETMYIILLLLLTLLPVITSRYSAFDYLIYGLLGYSKANVNLIELLRYLSFYVFPLVIIGTFWEREQKQAHELAKIRYGSLRIWEKQKAETIRRFLLGYSICYGIGYGIMLAAIVIVYGKRSSVLLPELLQFYGMEKQELVAAMLLCMAGHVLELLFLFQWNQLWVRLTGSVTISFLFTFVGYGVTCFPENVGSALTFGDAALYQHLENISQKGIGEAVLEYLARFCFAFGVCLILNQVVRRMNRWKKRLS